jgi:hypothetical protein
VSSTYVNNAIPHSPKYKPFCGTAPIENKGLREFDAELDGHIGKNKLNIQQKETVNQITL